MCYATIWQSDKQSENINFEDKYFCDADYSSQLWPVISYVSVEYVSARPIDLFLKSKQGHGRSGVLEPEWSIIYGIVAATRPSYKRSHSLENVVFLKFC